MKSHGNMLMNKIYNPRNIKPPVPTDVDEADSCMERFIRQKYQYRSLENGKPKPPSRDGSYTKAPEDSRRNRATQGSPEGSPPPLPPKSGKFLGFGLQSSSSTSNLRRSSKAKGDEKASYGLGAPVADVTNASFEAKMATLREMGFVNDRRNEMVLRGLNENLERAVETLVRLGEGSNPASGSRTPAPTSNPAPNSAVTPKVDSSTNPFEQTGANQATQQPQSVSYNPFDRPNPQPMSAQPLETSFQNLQVSQRLFPHSTGGYPSQSASMPQATYQQPFTPPATSFQGTYVSSPQIMDNSYNPFFQTAPPEGGIASQSYPNPSVTQNNPFFSSTAQNPYVQSQPQPQSQPAAPGPTLAVSNPPRHANTIPAISTTSPFGTSPFGPTPSFQAQAQQPQVPNAGQGSYNPFQSRTAPPTQQSTGGYRNQFQSQMQSQQQPQNLAPQATGRMDKNSILSLYNLAPSPSAIPPIPEQPQPQSSLGTSPVPPLTTSLTSTPETQSGSGIPTPQPSTNATYTASRNPFTGAAPAGSGLAAQAGVTSYQSSSGLGIGVGSGTGATAAPAMKAAAPTASGPPPATTAFPRHMSQPSVDISGLQNGRHSPDAFASLSARYG